MRLPSPLIRSGEANNAVGNAVLAPSRYNLARLIVNFDSTPSFGKSTKYFFLLTISILMIHFSTDTAEYIQRSSADSSSRSGLNSYPYN